jgi:hypothetical protein
MFEEIFGDLGRKYDAQINAANNAMTNLKKQKKRVEIGKKQKELTDLDKPKELK